MIGRIICVLVLFSGTILADNKTKLRQADTYRQKGNFKKAIRQFEEIENAATDESERTEARLKRAVTTQMKTKYNSRPLNVAKDALRAKYEPVIAQYQQTLKSANTTQQQVIRNNLASVFLELNEPAAALEQLQKINLKFVPKTARHIVRYNQGRAFQLQGKIDEAMGVYTEVLTNAPRFSKARRHFWEILGQNPVARFADEVVRVCNATIQSGQVSQSLSWLLECLEKSKKDDPHLPLLMDTVVQGMSAEANYSLLESRFLPRLKDLADSKPSLAKQILEIERGITVDYELSFPRPGQYRLDGFPVYSEANQERRAHFSQLITNVGKHFNSLDRRTNKPRDERKALKSFALALGFNKANTDAGVRVATVLKENRKSLDPNGELRRDFVSGLFQGKGQLYALSTKNSEDWQNLRTMHVMLGSIFEEDENWGNDRDPTTASGQWRLAVRADETLSRMSRNTKAQNPWLLVKYAEALQHSGKSQQAMEQLKTAVTLSSNQSDRSTIDMIRKEKSNPVWKPQQIKVIDRLQTNLELP